MLAIKFNLANYIFFLVHFIPIKMYISICFISLSSVKQNAVKSQYMVSDVAENTLWREEKENHKYISQTFFFFIVKIK